jgi:hypothetical protein
MMVPRFGHGVPEESGTSGSDSGSGAIIVDDYRYLLWRTVDEKRPGVLVWVMLNPSTADATTNDNTIKKCMKLTRYWGYGRMEVVNLFAYRSTDPKALYKVQDPIGVSNDSFLRNAFAAADRIVCAWGANGKLLDREKRVPVLAAGKSLWCLKVSEKTGSPYHPLYQPDDSKLSPWSPR